MVMDLSDHLADCVASPWSQRHLGCDMGSDGLWCSTNSRMDNTLVSEFSKRKLLSGLSHKHRSHMLSAGSLRETLSEPLWQPSRLTSPYCVLCASGVLDDFYTSCLSWGRENVVLALRDKVLLFRSSSPLECPASLHLSGSNNSSDSQKSSVAVSQFSDSHCFLGGVNGSVGLYESSGSGELTLSSSFSMPPPILECTTLSEPISMAATASVRCLSTTNVHPWMVAAGTAANGLFILDSRCRSPAARMGDLVPWTSMESTSSPRIVAPGVILSMLSSVSGVCGASWNASGSLVATGESGGVVNIWSLSNTRTPVQRIRLPSVHTTIKAVAFHPTNPYEVVLGGGADDGCVRVFDVSSSVPHNKWCVSTGCQVTQSLYSPDGLFIISAHGTHVKGNRAAGNTDMHFHASRRGPSLHGGGDVCSGAGEQICRLTERFERVMSHEEWPAEVVPGCSASFGGLQNSGVDSFRPLVSEAPPFSLMMWRKGTQHHGTTPLGYVQRDQTQHHQTTTSWRNHPPLPLMSMYAMNGHRSRPLQLSAPFSQTVDQGCIASVAGGADCTIRFWKCFCSKSEMANWEQRMRASLRAAVTDEDVEGVMAMPLR
uniref:Uncharacterized protein n=1 Tax=Trypanosoma congolense (strain IL3000) TaxID=1068625 RepID=G0UWM7_TRYCI|nr:conserved hypothetical protein [Trypanosoma congolense IL3000]